MPDSLHRRTGIVVLRDETEPFVLESGAGLAPLVVAYETYGRLNAGRDNAIVVCHALTGSAHAAGLDEQGRPGWWSRLIGPGCAIDTDRWFVICSNVIGSCYGSTGPGSIGATGDVSGRLFPAITIRDMVHAQALLVRWLGAESIHAAIGGSMGGMQVIEWALLYPELVGRIVPIATSAAHSPWCVAFNAIAREAIALGGAAGDTEAGLRLARKVAMMTYRSDTEFAQRFGRERLHRDPYGVEGSFTVEGYLEHHGRSLAARFSAESLVVLTRAMDLHDVARGRGDLANVLGSIQQPALSIGITSDVLYPEHEQRALAHAIPDALYRAIDSPCGHDAFLIETDQLADLIRPFINGEQIYPASTQSFIHHLEEVETL